MARKKALTIHAAFTPFVQAQAELDKKIKTEGEKAVKQFFADYFNTHPEVYGVKWEQYAPYFNDGSPCVFSLHAVFTFKTKEAFEDEKTSMYNNEGADESYDDEPRTSLEQIEDILESIFGEHAKVAVTRTSIETEECCDHD